MTTLLNTIESFLAPYLQQQSRVVLALSGGLDSRVLLDVLIELRQRYSFYLKAVHVHHGLSHNADAWALQCHQWCSDANVDFSLERVSLNCDSGDSIENLARTARYNALALHVEENSVLITAQHGDDQVETFLLALKRGSGPKGLSAMPSVMAFRQGLLLRPLLTTRRSTIYDYALARGLSWVEDESNQDTRFDRNFIRHHVTPALTQRWPHFSTSLQRSALLCAQQEQLLDELLQARLDACVFSDKSISILSLSSLSEAARSRLLRMWMSNFGLPMPSQAQLKLLWSQVAQAQSDANPKMTFKQHEIRRFDQRLYCVALTNDVTEWRGELTTNTPLKLPDQLGTLTLYDTVSVRAGLTLNRQVMSGLISVGFNPEGIRAHPQGKSGSKTLKKWYQEFGIPSWQRRRTPILFCDGTVVAVANLFVDRQYCGKDCELVWD
jgi:tRNA(Ile)-lysidine synthase